MSDSLTTMENTRSIFMARFHWLLTFLVLSNDTECLENINENISTQAENIGSTTEYINQSSPDRILVNTSSDTVKDITTVGPSTASAITPLVANAFQPVNTSQDRALEEVSSNKISNITTFRSSTISATTQSALNIFETVSTSPNRQLEKDSSKTVEPSTATATKSLAGNLFEPVYTSPDQPLGRISNTANDLTTFGPSYLSVIPPLAVNMFESLSAFGSVHDSQYFENTRGNNPIQSTHEGYNQSSADTSDEMYSINIDYNMMAADTSKSLVTSTTLTIDPLHSIDSLKFIPDTSSYQNSSEMETLSPINPNNISTSTPFDNYQHNLENELYFTRVINQSQYIESANFMPSTLNTQNSINIQTFSPFNQSQSYNLDINRQENTEDELLMPLSTYQSQPTEPANSLHSTLVTQTIPEVQTLVLIQFKSYFPNINSQEEIDDELVLPLGYQYMFDKRTSPWEMKDWDQDDLNAFTIQSEKIDRLYHMVANDEDPNFRSWELCCRMDYNGVKYFVEMYANCDYTGFDCQGGGHICITKLADFFLSNMVTNDQNPDQIYRALLEDGYDVNKPDPLHKMHPKFWNNTPMLKYLCHNAIFENKEVLPHFKDHLPRLLANSVDDFIKVKEWENE